MALSLATATRNAAADAVADLTDGGTIELRTGAKPASANDAASGTLLATVTVPTPAFDSAATGTVTLQGVPLEVTAVADGTAGHFRLKDSVGATVLDGTAGTSGTDLILTAAAVTTGDTVKVTSGTLTMPA